MALSLGSAATRFKVADGNLGILQEYLRGDPESYREEFLEQFQHFLQFVKLLDLEPKLHRSSINQLLEVVNFLTAVVFCYPEQSKIFGAKLIEILSTKAEDLEHELRLAFCRALVALRNAQRISAMELIHMLFELLKCDDKQLRKFIKVAILSTIKHTKNGSKKQKRNRRKRKIQNSTTSSNMVSLSADSSKIQAFLFAKIHDSRPTCARIAQWILIQAYKKEFWRDTKTANVLSECVFHKLQRVQLSTMRFFLGSIDGEDEDEDSDSENDNSQNTAGTLRDVVSSLKYGKKTKKRAKDLERAKKEVEKSRKAKKESRSKFCNLEALQSIYDPQKFCDRLFNCLESKRNEKFAIRLLQIALCARFIGIHHLQTLGFYSYIQRYLQPKQRDVTRILLFAAQACHELVPPDLVENLVRRIAQNFITDQNTAEAITVGLNTIREIFSSCPASATEELLKDLTEYKSYKNKNVSMAARALIILFRSVNPQLLHHKDRGRPIEETENTVAMAASANNNNEFGALHIVDFVPGAEILKENEPAPEPRVDKRYKKRGCKTRNKDKESEWIDVDNSDESAFDEDENVSDSGWVTDNDKEDLSDVERSNVEEENDEEGWETCSDDEENSEKNADDKKVSFKLSKVQKKRAKVVEKEEAKRQTLSKAKLVSESRILTDSDFRAIRVHQIRRQMSAEKRLNKFNRKRTNDEVLLDEETQEKFARKETGAADKLTCLNDIEHFRKKIYRQSKAERLAQAEINQEERGEFGRPKSNGPHVGRTNREMAKRKNFQMVRQKMRGKNRQRSFRDRQISLRNYLMRQSGRKV